jgi:hypothetical protein
MPATLDRPERTMSRSKSRSTTRSKPRSTSTWLGQAFVVMGMVMIPWLCYLAVSLPDSAEAVHWAAAWVGLDSCEALALFSTGWLLLRGDSRCALTATATSVLLSIDAWFDVTTSAPGTQMATAVAMAVCVEIPLASLCAVLALQIFRSLTRIP